VRAETRHQLKEDRFSKVTMEAAGKTVDWSQEHKGILMAGAVALAIIAAIAVGGWYYVNSQDQKASLDLSVAVRTMETPVRPAGTPEQPGFPSFDSSTARATEARKQFQAIVDKYSSTHSGKVARYFVGLASAQLADYPAAEHNLQETANSSDSDLASLAKLALASVYASEKKDDQAVDLYKQLSDRPTVLVSKPTAQFELAGFYASHQKLDDAKKTYELIQKENPSTEVGSLAQQRLAALK
jgi:predicted negative regulator of RcsB-dependent stress response